MHHNLKRFAIKSAILLGIILALIAAFRFPVDYFHLKDLAMNQATRLFSKSDALKVMALAVLFFTLYYKERIAKIKHEKQPAIKTAVFILGGVLATTTYYALRYLSNVKDITQGATLYLVMLASAVTLIIAFASLTTAIFTPAYLKRFYHSLKKPLWITAALAAVAYLLLMWFQSLWPLFSRTIARILYALFTPFYPTYLELSQAPLLDVNGFSVTIGAPCSGIESLFLFAAFSVGIYALDHKRLKKKLYLATAALGLIGIYFVNIARLYLLILAGIYVNPEFAVGLFHTNVGWILFVIYFLIYYYIITKFIYKAAPPKVK